MANGINNKYEYRSGLLDSLNVQHTASDVRNEDEYRKKVLNGLGVEYTEDDINQKNLYRAKVVEGLASSGGGGESDFSTAEVTVNVPSQSGMFRGFRIYGAFADSYESEDYSMGSIRISSRGTSTITLILYKGIAYMFFEDGITLTTEGLITYDEDAGMYKVTGDCTITIS